MAVADAPSRPTWPATIGRAFYALLVVWAAGLVVAALLWALPGGLEVVVLRAFGQFGWQPFDPATRLGWLADAALALLGATALAFALWTQLRNRSGARGNAFWILAPCLVIATLAMLGDGSSSLAGCVLLAAILARFLAFEGAGPSPLRRVPQAGAILFGLVAVAAAVVLAAAIRYPLATDADAATLERAGDRVTLHVPIRNAGPQTVRFTEAHGYAVRSLDGELVLAAGEESDLGLVIDCERLGGSPVVRFSFEAGGHARSQLLRLPTPRGRCHGYRG